MRLTEIIVPLKNVGVFPPHRTTKCSFMFFFIPASRSRPAFSSNHTAVKVRNDQINKNTAWLVTGDGLKLVDGSFSVKHAELIYFYLVEISWINCSVAWDVFLFLRFY